jgi:adenylate cyclase
MTEILSPALIEAVLSTVFDYFKKRVVTTPSDRANFDFVLKGDKGEKIAIEVKGQNLNLSSIVRLKDALTKHNDIDEFILITPDKPNNQQLLFFKKHLLPEFPKSKWLSLKEFLKANYNVDINNSDDLAQLQIAAITSKIDLYSQDIIGNQVTLKKGQETLKKNLAEAKKGEFKVQNSLISLRRQFPDSLLATLKQENENLLSDLHIGEKYNDAIIVLTDIKNFSSIVKEADPEDLNEAMGKYYTNARDLVFKYNGILDKFIGDAVLAIFNYPKKNLESYINTIKFCSELIQLGDETFQNLLSKMDQAVETGTRVGVSNGPIYTLNIGKGDIEVTFIGDKINFAARLEKNCEINGILVSNRFYNKLTHEFSDLTQQLQIDKKDISPTDAKGQTMTTTAWQIKHNDIQKIIDFKVK